MERQLLVQLAFDAARRRKGADSKEQVAEVHEVTPTS
jgi:hypothetical protein